MGLSYSRTVSTAGEAPGRSLASWFMLHATSWLAWLRRGRPAVCVTMPTGRRIVILPSNASPASARRLQLWPWGKEWGGGGGQGIDWGGLGAEQSGCSPACYGDSEEKKKVLCWRYWRVVG